ncbi:MAG: hypothetical protein NMNS01_17740 [Nitrosomonas sp.]|nr:MAG: hypothetical protein NMNS01_17740 [Nitrosomonas sp.]
MKNEKKESGSFITLPSLKTISILIIVVAGILFLYEVGMDVARSRFDIQQGKSTEPTSFSGNIGLIAALFSALVGVVIFLFQQFWSQLIDQNKRTDKVLSEVEEKIKERFEEQSDSIIGRYDRLSSKIDTLEEKYPWLNSIAEMNLVSNVSTDVALLDTISKLLEHDNREFAYEWLVEASKDENLQGSPLNFLGIAIISGVLFSDQDIVKRMLLKSVQSASRSTTWQVVQIIHQVQQGEYTSVNNSILEIEKQILSNSWVRDFFNKKKLRRRDRDKYPPEVVGTLIYYYEKSGDKYALKNIIPKLRKKLGDALFEESRNVATLLKNNDLKQLMFFEDKQVKLLFFLMQIDKELMEIILDPNKGVNEIDTLVRSLFIETGNRQLAKAFSIVAQELIKDREVLGIQSYEFSRSVLSKKPSLNEDNNSDLKKINSLLESWAKVSRNPFDFQRPKDPFWGGQWKPGEKNEKDLDAVKGGIVPEKIAAENLKKALNEQEKIRNKVKNHNLLISQEELKNLEIHKSKILEEFKEHDDDKSFNYRNLDIIPGKWQDIEDDSIKKVVVIELEKLNLELDSNNLSLMYNEISWLENTILLRASNESWSDKALRIFFLFGVSGELEGRIFWLDGSREPIHEVNKIDNLSLDKDNVVDYLKFFCFFGRDEEGYPFHVIESCDDFLIPRQTPESTLNSIRDKVDESVVLSKDSKGNMIVLAHLYYENSLFYAEFEVSVSGKVEMITDNVLLENLEFLKRIEINPIHSEPSEMS